MKNPTYDEKSGMIDPSQLPFAGSMKQVQGTSEHETSQSELQSMISYLENIYWEDLDPSIDVSSSISNTNNTSNVTLTKAYELVIRDLNKKVVRNVSDDTYNQSTPTQSTQSTPKN